ncbi:hypothetical protein EON65_55055, partial [archaeon]
MDQLMGVNTVAYFSYEHRPYPQYDPRQVVYLGSNTIHHTPYTIHHTPYTIHHTPYTIHHTPYT